MLRSLLDLSRKWAEAAENALTHCIIDSDRDLVIAALLPAGLEDRLSAMRSVIAALDPRVTPSKGRPSDSLREGIIRLLAADYERLGCRPGSEERGPFVMMLRKIMAKQRVERMGEVVRGTLQIPEKRGPEAKKKPRLKSHRRNNGMRDRSN